MCDEHPLHAKIRDHILAKYSKRFNPSIIVLETVENPSRFDGRIFLVVVTLKHLEENISASLAQADPDDIERLKKKYSEGIEVTSIFDSSGEEVEQHFRGRDYFFDYQKIEI